MRAKLPYGYDITGEDATTALNRWFKINGIDKEVTVESCQNIVDTTDDIAQKKIGLDADKIYTQYYDGTEYYTADFCNEDGVTMIKVINVEGMIHWMTQSMSQVAWNFMSQYARDTGTGELIVLNQDDEPQLEPQEIEYKTQGSFIQDYSKEAEIGEPITITVKASADVTDFVLTMEDGTPLNVESTKEDGSDGFTMWTLQTSVDRAGKAMLQNDSRNRRGRYFRAGSAGAGAVRSQSVSEKLRQNEKQSQFVERFPELSLFFKAYSLLDSEMICIFPYFCPYAESTREIREFFIKRCSLLYQEFLRNPSLLFLLSERRCSLWY